MTALLSSKNQLKRWVIGVSGTAFIGLHRTDGGEVRAGDCELVLAKDADAEIERLARELEVQKAVVDLAYIPHRHLVESRDNATREIERLRAELDAAWSATGATERSQGLAWQISAMGSLSRERMDAIYAMRKERERLRATLERIADGRATWAPSDHSVAGQVAYWMTKATLIREWARKALAGLPVETGARISTVYRSCAKHVGLPWTLPVGIADASIRKVCPICEPPTPAQETEARRPVSTIAELSDLMRPGLEALPFKGHGWHVLSLRVKRCEDGSLGLHNATFVPEVETKSLQSGPARIAAQIAHATYHIIDDYGGEDATTGTCSVEIPADDWAEWNRIVDLLGDDPHGALHDLIGVNDPGPPAAMPPEEASGVRAVEDVLAERRRQQTAEGWTVEHDDQHDDMELSAAAACYAAHVSGGFGIRDYDGQDVPVRWPWSPEWWKPKDARRDLVRAGALILAEIERLDRAPKGTREEATVHGAAHADDQGVEVAGKPGRSHACEEHAPGAAKAVEPDGPAICAHRWAPTMGGVYDMCIDCGERRPSAKASDPRYCPDGEPHKWSAPVAGAKCVRTGCNAVKEEAPR